MGTRLCSLGERDGEEDCGDALRPLRVPAGGQASSRAASLALHEDGAVSDCPGKEGRSLVGMLSHSAHTMLSSGLQTIPLWLRSGGALSPKPLL